MLTVTSHPAQIRRELDEDERRAQYWFTKQHHGEKGLERWRREQCRRLWLSTEWEWFSEPVEYKSPNGNRWLAYEHVQRDGEGGVFSFTYCVCYFETLGSVGAIVRCDTQDPRTQERMAGCIIFTPHFFQRFAERLGLEFRSRGMMLRFLQLAHHHVIMEREPRPGFKDVEIVMKYPASYAMGSRRDVDGYRVVTVRTFLPVTMMTPAKRRELEKFGELNDKVTGELALQRMNEMTRNTVVDYF